MALVRAILMVFASSGLLPTSNDVLFCSDLTQQTILETFILRALLFDVKINHQKSGNSDQHLQLSNDKVFVIANFHKLNL